MHCPRSFCLPLTVCSVTSETGLVKAARELQKAGWTKRKHLKPEAMTEDNPCEHSQLAPRLLGKDSRDHGGGGGGSFGKEEQGARRSREPGPELSPRAGREHREPACLPSSPSCPLSAQPDPAPGSSGETGGRLPL